MPADQLETDVALLQAQLSEAQQALSAQEQLMLELRASDAKQWRLLRMQRKVQAGCILALAIAVVVGFAGFSSENRQTLEKLAIGIITAASLGYVGADYVSEQQDK